MKINFLLIILIIFSLRLDAQINEQVIGSTFYDLQTNNSISNCVSVNSDGTISAVWNFSPNAIQTTAMPFPDRRSGYVYYDGSTWIMGPNSPDNDCTGFPNIVVTPTGKEMIISHSSTTIDTHYISICWRAMKGVGAWDTLMAPWGSTNFSLPKACGGITNENVYVIFLGNVTQISAISPPNIEGGRGQLHFAKSIDGGVTWSASTVIPQLDTLFYKGFSGDAYSIDAIGDTIAISFGDEFTDVGLLISTDAGVTWTKTIVQSHPQPFYDLLSDSLTDINSDGVADTISSNSGDSKVLIDNNGMCHVWFSSHRYINDSMGDGIYTPIHTTNELFYWNESMPVNAYVPLQLEFDWNGNGILDVPSDTTCNLPYGNYGGGVIQMPSAGIDAFGKIYLTYQSVNELTDTIDYKQIRKHIYVTTLSPPYNPYDWTFPYNIIPDFVHGGFGEYQEAVFASTARRVIGSDICIIFQRDGATGHALTDTSTCDFTNNFGNSSDIFITQVDALILGIDNKKSDFYVSQNYPNPFSGNTSIDVQLSKKSKVQVEISDMLGRLRHSESKGTLSAGKHTLQINSLQSESGIYLLTIFVNDERVSKKIVVN
jgi:hypothetical protein